MVKSLQDKLDKLLAQAGEQNADTVGDAAVGTEQNHAEEEDAQLAGSGVKAKRRKRREDNLGETGGIDANVAATDDQQTAVDILLRAAAAARNTQDDDSDDSFSISMDWRKDPEFKEFAAQNGGLGSFGEDGEEEEKLQEEDCQDQEANEEGKPGDTPSSAHPRATTVRRLKK